MLEISPRKVVHIIYQAREGHLVASELAEFIDTLNVDEQSNLVALAWVGREVYEPEDFDEAVRTALEEASTPTSDYLMGMPHLAENLEYGLEQMGLSVSDIEEDFL